jgi:hypothetical protein
VGDLTAADANEKCDCLHDKTKDCKQSSTINGATIKKTKVKAVAPTQRKVVRPAGR